MRSPTAISLPVSIIALLTSLLAGVPAKAEDRSDQTLTILVTTGISGQLVTPEETTVATLAAAVQRLAAEASSDGAPVVILDAGRTIAPFAESRIDGGATMLEVLQAAGCQAFAPNEIDLTVGVDRLSQLAATTQVPILRPFSSSGLESLPSHVVLDAGPVGVVVHSVLSADELDELASIGIVDAAAHDVAELAATRPDDLVVAIVHSAAHGRSLTERSLSWRLVEEPGGVDLLIDPDMGHSLVVEKTQGGPQVALVGLDQDAGAPWSVARIDLRLQPAASGWHVIDTKLTVVPVEPSNEPDPVLEHRVRSAFAAFRSAVGQPLPAAAPDNREELERFVLEAMREAARAEVAVLNRGGLRPVDPVHFEGGRVSFETVSRLLSINQWLVTVTLTGEELIGLHDASKARLVEGAPPPKDTLVFAGISDDASTVNGRPIHEHDAYTVVTTSYLAGGGDDYEMLAQAETTPLLMPSAAHVELRDDVVIPRLKRADVPFPDLSRKPLWRYGVDRFRLSAVGVRTDRPNGYEDVSDSRVTADDSSSVFGELELHADMEMPSWVWENRLRSRYGVIDSEGSGERELDDDIRFNSTVAFSDGSWLLGSAPFLGLTLDSELRRNTHAGQTLPRQLEETLAAGLGWSSGRWTMVRIGAVARRFGNSDRADQRGLNVEIHYQVDPEDHPWGLSSRLYLEHLRDGAVEVERLDAEIRLMFPIRDHLLLTPGITYYLYDDSNVDGTAEYLRYSLGLTFRWQSKHQAR